MQLSASSAALDLAAPQTPGPDSSGWSAFARHRPAQQSLPDNAVQMTGQNGATSNGSKQESPISVRPSYRHSLDLKYYGESQQDQSQITSPTKHIQATPPKLQSSYSANDVPTMKSTSNGIGGITTTPNSHAQQHFHNHNASLGRIPQNAINNRQSRDMSGPDPTAAREVQAAGYQTTQSALQASAPAFGPPMTPGISQPQSPGNITSPTISAYAVPSYYNNYSMQIMAMGMQNMQLGQPIYPPQNTYPNYGAMYPQNGVRGGDSQSRIIAQRRQNDGEGMFVLEPYYFSERLIRLQL